MPVNMTIPQLEAKTTSLGKGIRHTRRFGKTAVAAAVLGAAATIGMGVKNANDNKEIIAPETTVPAGIALASAIAALGASKRLDKQQKTYSITKNDLDIAINKEKEEARLAEKKRIEELRKADELKQAEEKAKSRLSDIENLPNQRSFHYGVYLGDFGVVDKKPFKKVGGDYTTEKPVEGRDYTEYYTSKDGYTVVAGIRYANTPQGVDRKDYSYRYVKVLDPKVNDVVCEVGQLGFLDENGYAVYLPTEEVLSSYEKNWRTCEEERKYVHGRKYYAVPSNKRVEYFPAYEQQVRKVIMNNAIGQLVGWDYENPIYSTNTVFDSENGNHIYK